MLRAPKTPPTASSPSSRLWKPQNGIVFDVPRNLSTLQSTGEAIETAGEDLLPLRHTSQDYHAATSSIDAGAKSPNKTNDESIQITTSITSLETEVVTAKVEDVEPEHTPLTFQISPELLEVAKNAEPESRESYWSHTLYRRPAKPGAKVAEERVIVHYCKSKETTERVAKYFTEDKVIGFDIEWSVPLRPGPKNNVSLIQIANEERIALFHVALFPKNGIENLVAPTLKKIMEDPNITKVGVAIRGDCTRLRKHLEIDSKGMFELSHLYKLVRYSQSGETSLINKRLVSLATQVEEHLNLPIYKGEEVRSSDWSQPLNMDQITYAASDSYAGLRLYDNLEAQRKQLKPTPPRPHFVELMLPIRLADGVMIETTSEETEEIDPQNPTSPDLETTTPTAEPTPKAKRKPKEPKETPPPPKVSPEAQTAEAWVTTWITSLPQVHKIRATNRSLQAYSLWHIQGFSVQEVAALLREQPLATSTVRSYILEAVQLESLAFDKARMRELIAAMPEVVLSRYRRVVGQL